MHRVSIHPPDELEPELEPLWVEKLSEVVDTCSELYKALESIDIEFDEGSKKEENLRTVFKRAQMEGSKQYMAFVEDALEMERGRKRKGNVETLVEFRQILSVVIVCGCSTEEQLKGNLDLLTQTYLSKKPSTRLCSGQQVRVAVPLA